MAWEEVQILPRRSGGGGGGPRGVFVLLGINGGLWGRGGALPHAHCGLSCWLVVVRWGVSGLSRAERRGAGGKGRGCGEEEEGSGGKGERGSEGGSGEAPERGEGVWEGRGGRKTRRGGSGRLGGEKGADR